MRKYMIRKCKKDGSSSHGFKYPLEVGSTVTCPNWNPNKKCGGGLHGLEDANGDWTLLDGTLWLVISYEEEDRVIINEDQVKIKQGSIEYCGNKKGMSAWSHLPKTSQAAFKWARYIGNRDIMINRVTDQEYVFYWGCNIGNRDIMKYRIKDLHWITRWNFNFPEHQIKIKEPQWEKIL